MNVNDYFKVYDKVMKNENQLQHPTICRDCKFKINESPHTHCAFYPTSKKQDEFGVLIPGHGSYLLDDKRINVLIESLPYCIVFEESINDFVTGGMKKEIIVHGYCYDMNKSGSCQYYKHKK